VSTQLFVALIVVVLIVGALGHRWARTGRRKTRDVTVKGRGSEETFFAAVRNGEPVRDLVRVYSQMDIALLRSLLSSMGIVTYTLFENTNNIRMGIAIAGYNDTIVQILEKDYKRARIAVEGYIANRRRDGTGVTAGTKIRNVAETLVGGMFANPNLQLPELIEPEDSQSGRPVKEKPREARTGKSTGRRKRSS
jgi:hypothetical protein